MDRWPFPSDPVAWLVRHKFGDLDQKYELVNRAGSNIAVKLIQAKQFEQKLREMTTTVFENQYTQALREMQKALPGAHEPVERLAFHNLPRAKPDLEFWSKASVWTLEEATALSLGRDPGFINWKSMESQTLISSFAHAYKNVRELVLRAKQVGQLFEPVLPGFFIAWAKRIEIYFPPELEELIRAKGHQIANWQDMYNQIRTELGEHQESTGRLLAGKDRVVAVKDEEIAQLRERIEALLADSHQRSAQDKPLGTREKESLLKLIIGMAKKGYSYDPGAARSEAIPDIVGDLQRCGVALDQDTVRKWLREAAALLPPEAAENQDS